MTFKNSILIVLVTVLSLVSCKEDEVVFEPVPIRDRAEQQIADRDSILAYLSTHYYNSSTFETPGNYSYNDIVITEMPQDESGEYYLPDPDNTTVLMDVIETHTSVFNDIDYENDIKYFKGFLYLISNKRIFRFCKKIT